MDSQDNQQQQQQQELSEYDLMERNVWAEEGDVAGAKIGLGDNIIGHLNEEKEASSSFSGQRRRESHGDEADLARLQVTSISPVDSAATAQSHEDTEDEVEIEQQQQEEVIEEAKTTSKKEEKGGYEVPVNWKEEEDVQEEKVVIAALKDLVPEVDRISLAALLFLTLYELSYRYCQYEYFIDTSKGGAQGGERRPQSAPLTLNRFRRKSVEDEHLLGSPPRSAFQYEDFSGDSSNLTKKKMAKSTGCLNEGRSDARIPLFAADFQRTVSSDFPPQEESQINRSTAQTQTHQIQEKPRRRMMTFGAPDQRIPFGEEMNNPETIQDAIFFNRSLDGNKMLCFALKSFQLFANSFMDSLYEQLQIEHQERMFIEQGITLGLSAGNLVKSLSFLQSRAGEDKSIDISFSASETATTTTTNETSSEITEGERLRSILCNLLLIILTVSQGKYGCRSRVLLKRIAFYFNVSWIDIVEFVEVPLLESITAQLHDEDDQEVELNYMNKIAMKERQKMLTARQKKKKRKRVVYMTAAAIGGGAIIGITTGLAAPLVGAGIGAALAAMKIAGAGAFFGSVGGTALITSGGVLTGTSIAGIKMEKRTREVEYFKFVPMNTEGENVIICVSGWLITQEGKGKDLPGRRPTSRSQQDEPTASSSSAAPSTSETPQQSQKQQKQSRSRKGTETSEISGPLQLEEKDDEDFDLPEDVLGQGLQDLITPYMGMTPINGQLHSLIFDPHILRTLGDALKIFASEVVSLSANVILAQTILSTLMAGLTWPMWLVKLGYLVDNPWSLGLDRAKKSGKMLADRIRHLGRSTTLVGFSLGARTIYYCLLELAKEGCFGLIEDVFLFGTPVLIPANVHALEPPTSVSVKEKFKEYVLKPDREPEDSPNRNEELEEWRMILSIVGGRFVNAYSRSDWILGFLFRASVAGIWDVAGMRPVLLDSSMDVRSVDDYKNGKYLPGLSVFKKAHEEAQKMKQMTKKGEVRVKSAKKEGGGDSGEKSAKPIEIVIDDKDVKDLQSRSPFAILENVDITSQVDGHLQYRSAMPSLLKQICGFSTWTDDLEVIEETFGGEWIDQIHGWWSNSSSSSSKKRNRSASTKRDERQQQQEHNSNSQ